MTTPQTLRDLAGHRTGDEHDCFAMDCKGLGVEVVQLREQLTALLDRLEAAEAALREVPWWPLYDSAHGDPRSEQLNDWYEKHSDLIRLLSQPHSAEPDTKFRAVGLEPRYIEAHPGLREAPTPDRRFQPHSAEGGRDE